MRRAVQIIGTLGLWSALVFLGARRIGWMRGWLSVALYCISMCAIGLAMHRWNRGLIAERARWRRKDTKGFDKVFLALMLPLATVQPYVAGRDAGCAECSSMPKAFVFAGVILFVAGSVLTGWALVVNRHAETTVRIQADRQHAVVTWGPYGFVRHPMYDGVLLFYLGLPLIWGSLRALAISAAITVLFVWRTGMEDRTLKHELAGYKDYAATTRYRLVPRLW